MILITTAIMFFSIKLCYSDLSITISTLCWWAGVVYLFLHRHVTAFNFSDYSIDQSNCSTVVTCRNKFTTPPHQYGRLILLLMFLIKFMFYDDF